MAAALSKAIGRPVEFEQQPMDEVAAQFADMAVMYQWFERAGFSADLEALRRDYAEVEWLSFEQWANAQDWTGILSDSSERAA